MRRAVILFPSGFTLGNLFFGIFAIIAASRLEFTAAGVYVMLGGICDALDGRVARATNSGTQFGEELDSLVDAITFGLAPGMIMYFAVLNRDGWDWVFVFLFAACAVLRLARFNIEQAGTAKTYFQGLPSPAAGITLASYYWFSQSWLYSYGAVADLKWQVLLRFIMAALAILMISNVPYPAFPRTGFRSIRALGASLVVVGSLTLLITRQLEYFFPLSLIYVVWGLVRWVFFGLFERRQPTLPYDLSEDDEDEDEYEIEVPEPHATRPPRRTEPSVSTAAAERPRGRGERGERTPRPERAAPAPKAEPAAATERSETDVGRPERSERPKRTEAERTARREKREKRDKREGRAERAPRAAREASTDESNETELIPVSPDEAVTLSVEPIDGVVPIDTEEGDGQAGAAGATRKRKRRRRRGARDRGDATTSGAGTGDSESGDDFADEGPSRSPYSAPAPPSVPEHPAPTAPDTHRDEGERRPFTPPLPAPAPTSPTSPPSEPAE